MRCHDLANQVLDRARDEGRQGFDDELARIRAEYGERERHEAEHLARLAVSTNRNGYTLAWRANWVKQKRGSDG